MIDFLYQILLPFYFLIYCFIFGCSLYIAVYNKTIANWIITPLWYIGLSSLFINATIALEWIYGEKFSMSYSEIGFIGEIAFAASVAVTLALLFFNTVKQRRNQVESESL